VTSPYFNSFLIRGATVATSNTPLYRLPLKKNVAYANAGSFAFLLSLWTLALNLWLSRSAVNRLRPVRLPSHSSSRSCAKDRGTRHTASHASARISPAPELPVQPLRRIPLPCGIERNCLKTRRTSFGNCLTISFASATAFEQKGHWKSKTRRA